MSIRMGPKGRCLHKLFDMPELELSEAAVIPVIGDGPPNQVTNIGSIGFLCSQAKAGVLTACDARMGSSISLNLAAPNLVLHTELGGWVESQGGPVSGPACSANGKSSGRSKEQQISLPESDNMTSPMSHVKPERVPIPIPDGSPDGVQGSKPAENGSAAGVELKQSLTPMSKPPSEKELVHSAVAGNKDAYRQLVERYQERAFRLAFELLQSREDAEDIVQESFVKAYLSLESFKGESSFFTWLYRIIYNMSIDFKRRVARRGGQAAEYDDALHSETAQRTIAGSYASEGPHETLYRREQSERIQQVLNEISEEHRAVVVLREVDGLNYQEIADVVGVSKGTVMSRLHYARKKLQKVLRDLAPDGVRVREGEGATDEGEIDYNSESVSEDSIDGVVEAK